MKTGFIGAGKAGCSLSQYLISPQTEVSGFYSKTLEHSKQAADYTKSAVFSSLEDVVSNSDMIFVTTPDSMISPVWEEIKELEDQQKVRLAGKYFCHLSGSLSSLVFLGAQQRGVCVCAAHPMQAISNKEMDLAGVFFTLDGDQQAVSLLKNMLDEKGNPSAVIEPPYKKKYHMAASTASNLVVGLVQMAVDSLTECGFEPEQAMQMLAPLMLGNMESICKRGTAAALTGPAERCDHGTVSAHLEQLTGEKRDIYRLLSKQLIEIAQKKNQNKDYSKFRKILEEKDQ